MRVAIDGRVITDHFPGIGRYVYHLVDALAGLAPDDEFVVLHQPGQRDARYDVAELARHPNVHLAAVDARVFGLASQWRLPAAVRAARADVLHATYWITPLRPGVPTVLSLYDLVGLTPGAVPAPRRLVLAAAVRLALRTARHVVTLSEAAMRDIVMATDLPPSRVTVTPLAADARFRPAAPEAVAKLRAQLDLPARYALYVGINKPHKNLATLVAAWGRLAADRPAALAGATSEDRAALVVAGPWDPRYDEVRRQAEALPPGSEVRFLGPVSEGDLPTLYGGATVFAFPSRHEGFGLPPLEAMACGAPVVAAAASSLPEVVGDAGLLVDPDDVSAWSAALAELLTEPSRAAALRARGLERAAGFTWTETARRTMAVYRALGAS